jgi:addiction module RelE/StbE family toxin
VKLVWSALALNDRIGLFDYIAGDSVAAAIRVDDAIEAKAEQLTEFPESGRPGRVSETRELVIPGLPYILIYNLRGEDVFILRVLHGAQQWPDDLAN